MLTRREVVIEQPFRDRRYKNHRRKVQSALPRIDTRPPPTYVHLDVKMKKLRLEVDRQNRICNDNIGLLHRMSIIMRSKRMDNINMLPKGPFEPQMRQKYIIGAKSKTGIASPYAERQSFLEQLTKEASRRNPIPDPPKTVEHRAPHGFCKVPRLGLSTTTQSSIKSRYSQNFPRTKAAITPVSIVSGISEEREETNDPESETSEDNLPSFPRNNFRQCRPRTARIKSTKPIRASVMIEARTKTSVTQRSRKPDEPSSGTEVGSSRSSRDEKKTVRNSSDNNNYTQSFSSEEKSTEYSIVDKILTKIEYSIETDSDEKPSSSNAINGSDSREDTITEEEASTREEVDTEESPEEQLSTEDGEDEGVATEGETSTAEGSKKAIDKQNSDEHVSSVLLDQTISLKKESKDDDDFYK